MKTMTLTIALLFLGLAGAATAASLCCEGGPCCAEQMPCCD